MPVVGVYPGFYVTQQPPLADQPVAISTPDCCVRAPSPALVDHDPKTDGIGLFIGKIHIFES